MSQRRRRRRRRRRRSEEEEEELTEWPKKLMELCTRGSMQLSSSNPVFSSFSLAMFRN